MNYKLPLSFLYVAVSFSTALPYSNNSTTLTTLLNDTTTAKIAKVSLLANGVLSASLVATNVLGALQRNRANNVHESQTQALQSKLQATASELYDSKQERTQNARIKKLEEDVRERDALIASYTKFANFLYGLITPEQDDSIDAWVKVEIKEVLTRKEGPVCL